MRLKKFEELNENTSKEKKSKYFSSYDDAEKLGEQICDFIDRKGFVFNGDDNFDFYTELNQLLYKHILKKHSKISISNEPHEDYRKVHEEFFYEKKPNFGEIIGWMQEIYEWFYIEQEGQNRVRFDWRNGDKSFWLNDYMIGEGELPSSIKNKVLAKGIKIL